MRVWRVHDRAFPGDVWTGEGSKLYGGRWNPKGVAIVYTSEHAALALVEVMAGNLRERDLQYFLLHSAEVPDDCIVDLPAGPTDEGRVERWLASDVLGCRVPSAVVAGTNILLNPRSRDWARIKFHPPTKIDPRLYPGRPSRK